MRTNKDFSKHQLTIEKDALCKVYSFKNPDSIIYSIKLILVSGKTLITGDLGNWVFCREFEPSDSDERVSDGYWCEKLKTNSIQSYDSFSENKTKEAIEERIKDVESYHGIHNKEEAVEYYRECARAIDIGCSEDVYLSQCYDHAPPFVDYDDIIIERETHIQLLIIFDAFEEMCRRIKSGNYKEFN
jgi:hypothetical protein